MKKLFCSDMTQEKFLAEYWQKKPLLLKGAVPEDQLSCSPEELAGLSLEEDIESRLVTQDESGHWRLRHGPFSDDDFSTLGDKQWSLLVQDTQMWLDSLDELQHYARFLPAWRFDDIMISYATPGGGVGPHTDSYDVFLVQGLGKRRWRVGFKDDKVKKDDSQEMDLLLPFTSDFDCVVEPGDVLYLPAHTPHEGTAITPCMTYSIGFRSPTFRELVDAIAAEHSSKQRLFPFSDPLQGEALNCLAAHELATIQEHFFQELNQTDCFNQAFARVASTTKFELEPPEIQLASVAELEHLRLFPAATCRYVTWNENTQLKLAVAGQVFAISEALANWLEGLLQNDKNELNLLTESDLSLLLHLCNEGLLGFENT